MTRAKRGIWNLIVHLPRRTDKEFQPDTQKTPLSRGGNQENARATHVKTAPIVRAVAV